MKTNRTTKFINLYLYQQIAYLDFPTKPLFTNGVQINIRSYINLRQMYWHLQELS